MKYIIISLLLITSAIFYYNLTSPDPIATTAQATRVIDGDTLQLNDSTKIRLLGINTPESGQPYYEEAKAFLGTLENQAIQIEPVQSDKYGRTLAYIFHNKQNINEALLKNGLATLYYYEKDSYYDTLKKAEEHARTNQIGLWKPSPNANCITVKIFKTSEPEQLTLQNTCSRPITLTYKDDATHTYNITIEKYALHTDYFSHIWNDNGDTLYIYDTQGLIKFQRYQG
jgi:endonuclease YncB( thermonuclease family)